MNLKHLLFTTVFCIAALPVSAEDHYLHVQTAEGWKVLDIAQVDRLTFSNGFMTATGHDNQQIAQIKQTDLSKMFVTESKESASAPEISDISQERPFTFDASTKSVRILKDGDFAIFNVAGSKLLSIPEVKAGQLVDINAVKADIVIIKSGHYTVKAILK